MERKLDIEPHNVSGGPTGIEHQPQPYRAFLRLAVLFLAMLMPWLYVSYGLLILKDYRLTILMYELLSCGLMVLLSRPKLRIFPLKMPISRIFFAVLLVNVLILGTFKATNGFNMDWPMFYERGQATRLLINGDFWIFAAFIVILNPIFEESFWRGTVYREWRKIIGVWPAILVSSFFFGAWHWMVLQTYCQPLWALFLTFLVMVGGVLFAYSYEKTGTLGAPILLHGLGADFPMVFVVYDCILASSHLLK
ncbi:MAG: Abortive infection protein [Vampirovibrio sp.]|jgi:membrane protease YdiL (CAAX protease family)|nr:Abortive infection protein [Vampirovibrio sp.]